jgi:hypothetical protein
LTCTFWGRQSCKAPSSKRQVTAKIGTSNPMTYYWRPKSNPRATSGSFTGCSLLWRGPWNSGSNSHAPVRPEPSHVPYRAPVLLNCSPN